MVQNCLLGVSCHLTTGGYLQLQKTCPAPICWAQLSLRAAAHRRTCVASSAAGDIKLSGRETLCEHATDEHKPNWGRGMSNGLCVEWGQVSAYHWTSVLS